LHWKSLRFSRFERLITQRDRLSDHRIHLGQRRDDTVTGKYQF
jgi:hypothetical protein